MARLLLAIALLLAVIHYSLTDGSVSADSAFDQSKDYGQQFRRSLDKLSGTILGKATPERISFYKTNSFENMDASDWPGISSPALTGNACSVEVKKTIQGRCLKLQGSYACVTPDNIVVIDNESCA